MTIKDGCPEWAEQLIAKLRELEILAGNIPESKAWKSEYLTRVSERAFAKEEAVFDDKKAEFIYQRIVRGLHQEKFSTSTIAKIINTRIGYEGGPPYTNEQEVQEALEGKA